MVKLEISKVNNKETPKIYHFYKKEKNYKEWQIEK